MPKYILGETQILEKELMHYEHIKLLLTQKQNYLIESNPENIKQVTFEIEESIAKIRNLERERSELLDNFIATRLTRPAKDTLSWKKAFPGDGIPEKDLTMAFRSQERVKGNLRAILQDVAKIQETNRLLIQQGREVLQSCMECLLTHVSTETYDEKGMAEKKVDTRQRLLDQKI
ncbi:flagellar export chaperone FlgN [bacterium]|nr:flagellar export chaperone FlgN [bacterium]